MNLIIHSFKLIIYLFYFNATVAHKPVGHGHEMHGHMTTTSEHEHRREEDIGISLMSVVCL